MNNIIDLVEDRFDEWIFPAINDLYRSEGVPLGFLIMACAARYQKIYESMLANKDQ